jgi:DNA-directed RNA polymerase specialized sigma24 family protein
LPTAIFPNTTLAEFYRFALLLTGHLKTAERIMADTLSQVERQLEEFRHDGNRHAWLAARIRERCLRENAGARESAPRLLREPGEEIAPGQCREILKIEAFIVAQRFSTLPEPERSALALFYLELFTHEEIAKLLKVDTSELAGLLARGRQLLTDAINTTS